MFNHMSIGVPHTRATQEGRLVYLGNIHFQARKTEIADLLQSYGFSDCTIYWADLPCLYKGEHKGWCHVEFMDPEVAIFARERLRGASIRGRPIKTGPVQDTSDATRLAKFKEELEKLERQGQVPPSIPPSAPSAPSVSSVPSAAPSGPSALPDPTAACLNYHGGTTTLAADTTSSMHPQDIMNAGNVHEYNGYSYQFNHQG